MSKPVPPVLGSGHPRVQDLRRSLRRRSRGSGFVVLEGARSIVEAGAAGVTVRTIIVPESARDTEPVADAARAAGPEAELLVVRDSVYERLASTVTPQPPLAILDRPATALPDTLDGDDVVVVLVGVADPGNVGTLVRVADAVEARAVVSVGGADPWGDKAVRASTGSILRVPVVDADDPIETVRALRQAGARVVATAADGASPHHRAGLAPPIAVVLGSEAHGLSPEVCAEADEIVRIDMIGRAESLNVAMAGTLLAFETRRPGAL